MERKSFLDQEAPEGYVAGLARGAVGFRTSTSPDSFNRGIAIVQNEEEEEDEDNNNKTTTQLNEDGILSTKKRGKEDEDDEEADRIYNEIEKNYNPKKGNPQIIKMTEPSRQSPPPMTILLLSFLI